MDELHVIVGLGNPGVEYAKTRHNAGFLIVQKLAERWRVGWKFEKKFEAAVARGAQVGGKAVLLCMPQTYMNLSGEAVGSVLSFYQVAPERCLVVVDDADLELGQIRMRPQGSSGGHHGLESVQQHLGPLPFARLRVGIGRATGAREITGHVLGRFSAGEGKFLEVVLERAADQAECWLRAGVQKAMNQFNGAVSNPDNEGSKQ